MNAATALAFYAEENFPSAISAARYCSYDDLISRMNEYGYFEPAQRPVVADFLKCRIDFWEHKARMASATTNRPPSTKSW